MPGSGLSGAKWGFWYEVGNHAAFPARYGSMIEVDKFLGHLSWKHPVISGTDAPHSHGLLLSKLSFLSTCIVWCFHSSSSLHILFSLCSSLGAGDTARPSQQSLT